MKRFVLLFVLCVLTAGFCGSGPTPVARPDPVAEVREPEVRLRKLFLVRPDLLHYPIPYDVVC